MTVEDLKQMQRKLLFNPEGNDELTGRKIIGGETTNIFNLNNVKYTWIYHVYDTKSLWRGLKYGNLKLKGANIDYFTGWLIIRG